MVHKHMEMLTARVALEAKGFLQVSGWVQLSHNNHVA